MLATTQRTTSCREGCAACCRHFVMLSLPEARALASAIQALPAARQSELRERFRAALRAVEKAGILGPRGARKFQVTRAMSADEARHDVARRYFALKLDCPFLEHERCAIHAERPLNCREFSVTSDPQHCAAFAAPEARQLPQLRAARALARAAHALVGAPADGIPLLVLFEWLDGPGKTREPTLDGVAALRAFLAELRPIEDDAPAEPRA